MVSLPGAFGKEKSDPGYYDKAVAALEGLWSWGDAMTR